jgi:hypothetical protein
MAMQGLLQIHNNYLGELYAKSVSIVVVSIAGVYSVLGVSKK